MLCVDVVTVDVVTVAVSDDDGMDVDTSHAAANMACVLNFVKKMLAIVSLILPV